MDSTTDQEDVETTVVEDHQVRTRSALTVIVLAIFMKSVETESEMKNKVPVITKQKLRPDQSQIPTRLQTTV